MKLILHACLAFLLVSVSFSFAQAQPKKQLPEGTSAAWYSTAVGHLSRSPFYFKKDATAFHAVNGEQNLSFIINEKGYTVTPVQNKSWHIAVSLRHIASLPFSRSFSWQQEENRLVQHFKGVDVEYIHSAEGLRQNFIVKERKGPLAVEMRIATDLLPQTRQNKELSFIQKGSGKEVLRYSSLKVWDATGKVLPASMSFVSEEQVLRINVDDANAVYPVTIDPLNHNPEWTSSAEGVLPGLLTDLQLQVEGLHGFTVTALGDINDDGFDDVAISAPALVNIIAGNGAVAGVGAVFIYLGSNGGLATTPAYTLQPGTAIANALFGFSVAGGDVTGDGINDIIVGAPLDQVTVDVGSGQFIDSRVGRVYIFEGGSALTGVNPAPLLSLHLQTPLLSSTTIAVNPLFGFSLAVADDMNDDDKGEIIVGAPTYARIDGVSTVVTGGAFVYMSDDNDDFNVVRSLNPPTGSVLNLLSLVQAIVEPLVGSLVWNTTLSPLLSPLLAGQINGLLFGYSVDGAGNYNTGDTHKDVIVGAPAGVDLGSVNAVLNGQILGGTAWVFTGTGTDINTTAAARLQAASSGLLSNAANLFGYRVKGREDINGARDGGLFVTAPAGAVLSNVVGGLQVKAGQVFIFQKRTSAITNPVVPMQTLSSPRSSSILSVLTGQSLNLSLLFGGSIDNMADANCDGVADIIVGEPLSTAVGVIGADVVGGAAYIFKGNGDGSYDPTPVYTLHSQVSPVLGVNGVGMIGFSVAGAGRTQGGSTPVRPLVGAPANALDFGSGLLNLGNTISTLGDFTFDNNGLGKSFTFSTGLCGNITLPVSLLDFTGRLDGQNAILNWKVTEESKMNYYELERSADNRSFSTVSLTFAHNQANSSYAYTDKELKEGLNYYRLKMVDNESRIEYSATIVIRLLASGKMIITAGPNPFRQQVNLHFKGYTPGYYECRMVSATGQVVLSKKISIATGEQQVSLQVPAGLPTGVYWLNILGSDGEKTGAVSLVMAGQ